ncbi:MAG: hypothetical protein NTW16_16175 [Bacteroidetes bacterium]|nr:hypothetical protein [Bacteroidota bacterium]
MKKQTKIIISLVMVIAILIIGISLFYPEVFKGITSGTFGKADKYHKAQMTDTDIQLRSEYTADTGELRAMIQGLIYFSYFTNNLSRTMDSCVEVLSKNGMTDQKTGYSNVAALSDYSAFIRNNNKTLGTTISMLTGFYLNANSDPSADVEKNLRDFGNYVKNLNEKDSILELALKSIDGHMLDSKTLQARKTELASVKSIRDQLLIGSIQLSALLQDKPLCATLCSYAISSQSSLGMLFGQEKLGAINNQDKLAYMSQDKLADFVVNNQVSFGSQDQFGNMIQSQTVNSAIKSKGDDLGKLIGSVIIYDKANLAWVVGSAADLKVGFIASNLQNSLGATEKFGNMVGVIILSREGLNVFGSNFDLKSAVQSQELSSFLSASQMGVVIILARDGIGSVAYGSSFIGLIGQLNSQSMIGIMDK